MYNGCTVVATLTKHRTLEKAEDEQYHVLPLYVMDSIEGDTAYQDRVDSGAIEVLKR